MSKMIEGVVKNIIPDGTIITLNILTTQGQLFDIPFDWRMFRMLYESYPDLINRVVSYDTETKKIYIKKRRDNETQTNQNYRE